MKSTDHNINNPLKTLSIDLQRTVESWRMPKVVGSMSQEEYDLIAIKDPNSIYIVHTPDGKTLLYLGEHLIESPKINNKYYMGMTENGEYTIYVDQNAGTGDYFTGMQNLIPVCTYADPQVAMDQLVKFNKVGSHMDRDYSLYTMIKNYIEKEISTHELIVGILVEFNYREDCRLQNIIEFAVGHNAHRSIREFPTFYSYQIREMKEMKPESLFVLYSNLYDLIVKYDFFRDKKYQDIENLNLSDELTDITKVMLFLQ